MGHIVYIFRSAEARAHGFVQAAIPAATEEKARIIAGGFAFTKVEPPAGAPPLFYPCILDRRTGHISTRVGAAMQRPHAEALLARLYRQLWLRAEAAPQPVGHHYFRGQDA